MDEKLAYINKYLAVMKNKTAEKILTHLLGGEKTVTELYIATRVNVSPTLKLMRKAGIVEFRRAGKHHYYSVTQGHLVFLDRLRKAV